MEFRISRCLLLIVVAALWSACEMTPDGEPARAVGALECTHPDELGGSKYCRADCPCDDGEGDCDSDSECAAGLDCRKDIGAYFGWDPEVDVCVSVCSPLGIDVDDLCTPACPCSDGVGDCDGDADCVPGARCMLDVGPAYGYADPETDVCVVGCPEVGNGSSNYCSPECPCAAGEGDCDGDGECEPGLECAHNVGAQYGMDPDDDVCEGVASACADDGFEDNDTAVTATVLPFGSLYWDGSDGWATVYSTIAQLCSNDGDWYRVQSSLAPFPLYLIQLRFRALGSGWCGASCDDPVLPPGPQNTITVEAFDATGSMLLGTWTSEVGLLKRNVTGDLSGYGGDFLLRVSGPAAAQFGYQFRLELKTGFFEDECEC